MSGDPRRAPKGPRRGMDMGAWIALGLMLGTAVGVGWQNIPLGLALGLGVGTAVGAATSERKEK